MQTRMMLTPALEQGFLKASATLQDPDVRLGCWDSEMPTLTIEEGGISLELEFIDREALTRFQRRLAALQVTVDRGRPRG